MDQLAEFDDAVFGAGLPDEVLACLNEAGRCRSQPEVALPLLQKARQLAPEHPATLIALYRFHFYGHQLAAARRVAIDALALGARFLALPERWQAVPATALPGARFDAVTRFYLFSLKGCAYLSLRLGDLDTGERMLQLLRALDPEDRVGSAVLGEVLARVGQEEED